MLDIIMFIISPLKDLFMVSFFSKILIIVVLGYALYINTINTNAFNKGNVLFSGGEWSSLKTNLLSSYMFSLFIFILIISVFKKLF